MILTGFFSFIGSILKAFALVLPAPGAFGTQFLDMLTWVFETAFGLNWLFPVQSALNVLLLVIATEVAFASWTGAIWLIRMLRGN